MKMLDSSQLESVEQQEARSRERLKGKVVLKSGLLACAIVFVFPAGMPWISHDAFLTAFGRVIAPNFVVNLIGHIVVSLIYAGIIAACIFNLGLPTGIILGTALALPLYGLNYLLFSMVGGFPANEAHVALGHVFFCLIFSVAYKAMSVPRRRRVDQGR